MKLLRIKYIFGNSYKNYRLFGFGRISSIRKAYGVYCLCRNMGRHFKHIGNEIAPTLEDFKKAFECAND